MPVTMPSSVLALALPAILAIGAAQACWAAWRRAVHASSVEACAAQGSRAMAKARRFTWFLPVDRRTCCGAGSGNGKEDHGMDRRWHRALRVAARRDRRDRRSPDARSWPSHGPGARWCLAPHEADPATWQYAASALARTAE